MAENFPNKTANIDNPLARELVAARHKMRERLMIEGQKPLYKVSVASFTLWFYKSFNLKSSNEIK